MSDMSRSDNSLMEELPIEALRMIFHNLDTIVDKSHVEMVCKDWRDIGRTCWSNITKIRSQEWEIEAWRAILSRIGRQLEDVELNFIDGDDEANEFVEAVENNCTHLETLKYKIGFTDYTLHAPLMEKIIKNCNNLCRIEFYADSIVRNIDLNFTKLLPVLMIEIHVELRGLRRHSFPEGLSKFPNLRILKLKNVPVTDQMIDNVVSLEQLSLNRCPTAASVAQTIIRNNKGLKYVDIGDQCFNLVCTYKWAQQLPKLQVLSTTNLNNEDLVNMPKLKGLRYSSCTWITDRGIMSFFNSVEDIKQLGILSSPVTLKSTRIAREWTERTGKSLKLFVDSNLFELYSKSEWKNTDKFQVIESTSTQFADNWGLELLD